MKKVFLCSLILLATTPGFSKDMSRKITSVSLVAVADHIDARRAALAQALDQVTDVLQNKIANVLKLNTMGVNARNAIINYIQPEGENSNIINILAAESALGQALISK